jgi:hypothetical protein
VTEVLATLMRKAGQQGKIKGVLTHLMVERITHIQYTDDTFLMVEGDEMFITNMKFILYCFEWLFVSGSITIRARLMFLDRQRMRKQKLPIC